VVNNKHFLIVKISVRSLMFYVVMMKKDKIINALLVTNFNFGEVNG